MNVCYVLPIVRCGSFKTFSEGIHRGNLEMELFNIQAICLQRSGFFKITAGFVVWNLQWVHIANEFSFDATITKLNAGQTDVDVDLVYFIDHYVH